MKIVHGLDGDRDLPVTTANEDWTPETLAAALPEVVGVGNPFLVFAMEAELPGDIAWDYDQAPVVSADQAENRAAIDAMLASPPLGLISAVG